MRVAPLVLALLVAAVAPLTAGQLTDYMAQRSEFLRAEEARFLGSRLQLSPAEQAVNRILMRSKRREYSAPNREHSFPPARHFFHAKQDIEKSEVFSFIQKMPKGAALHLHDVAAAAVDYVINNVTYRDHLWARANDAGALEFKFALEAPDPAWALVSVVRSNLTREVFDQELRGALTLNVPNPDTVYPDQSAIWTAFGDRFDLLFSALTYAPVFRDYYRQTLQDFYDDNVMFVEMRGILPNLYDMEGRSYSPLDVATMYRDLTQEFVATHPGFLGARFIFAPSRHVPVSQFDEYVHLYRALKRALPNFIAGFDVVAREDSGRPLIDFVPGLLKMRQEEPDVKFFFHAGETNWEDSTDVNLVDAVLLNTTRVGHAYAIVKHPKVMEEVRKRGIGIEINPVSNQVLKLVHDMRNHPGATLLSDDYPVVISCDDPGLWGAKGLSYDFYEAFMGMAGGRADLRMLKKLAINSLMYSSLSDEEKRIAVEVFSQHWKTFIDNFLASSRSQNTIQVKSL